MRDRFEQWWQPRREQLASWARPRLAPAIAWYRQRDEREQRALQLLAAAAAVMLVYLIVWQPVMGGYQAAKARYQHNQGLLAWIQSNADAVRQQRSNSPQRPAGDGDDWINVINSSASREGLSLRGFTPEGNDAVRVTLEQQNFAAAMGWLQALDSEYGIRAATIEVTAGQQPGTVNIRATLRRTG